MSNRTLPTNATPSKTNDANAALAKVKSNNHAVQVYADMGIWDATSNVYVLPEDTNWHSSK
jgi:hypothetical protein